MFLFDIVDEINTANDIINDIVWGLPMIIFILATGIYLSIRLGFFQIIKIKEICKQTICKVLKKSSGSGIVSSVEAAFVSMGEIVGSGNIAGVATAVASGGPGAIFWMWIAAFFGMAIKFAEIVLGLLYRRFTKKEANVKGGPMYYLQDGVNSKFLAIFYSIMAMVSYIVIVAMVDTNTIVNAVNAKFDIPNYIIALILVVIVGAIIFGGLKRIGKFSKWFVPIMGMFYIVSGLIVILYNFSQIGDVFSTIFKSAFTPQAAAGGFAGATVIQIMRYGLARGIYSNEAGLGTAAVAHAASQTNNPVKQALWGPVEIFFDTIIINTITGIVVVMSGLWTNGTSGAELVMNAYDKTLSGGFGNIVILISSILFSFTCLTSASYICEESAEYLFGTKSKNYIKIFWLIFIVIGALTSLEFVWNLADTVNGLMLIPNLIGILVLSNKVIKLKKEYFININSSKKI